MSTLRTTEPEIESLEPRRCTTGTPQRCKTTLHFHLAYPKGFLRMVFIFEKGKRCLRRSLSGPSGGRILIGEYVTTGKRVEGLSISITQSSGCLVMLLILADELSICQRYSLVQKVESDHVSSYLDKKMMAKTIKISVQTQRKKSIKIVVKPEKAHKVLNSKFETLKPLRTAENDKDSYFLDYRILFR